MQFHRAGEAEEWSHATTTLGCHRPWQQISASQGNREGICTLPPDQGVLKPPTPRMRAASAASTTNTLASVRILP